MKTAMDIVRLARHSKRPTSRDFIEFLVHDFVELHGDRRFADDPAIIGGIGFFESIPVTILGHQKGRSVQDNIRRHFGMAHPEGYRKALRLMRQAERFGRPVITLIDTPGAYPGVGAEERGQAEAIATNLYEMSGLRVPIVALVTGEGGSGGALGIGVADRIYMLANAIYSVISPEGCASILWKDSGKAPAAAEALRLRAVDLLKLGVIDGIVAEPGEGAHERPGETMVQARKTIAAALKELLVVDAETLMQRRYAKFRAMGVYAHGDGFDGLF
ncbi:MAG: acetyl-CoA carboxylase carboxyltransferase subunit alpha [Candidatus Aminicenantes bacterium]|nr:acetyl-CoA carboxylase carboxyltransferase subunit alpha [Candidatus Aminicenantes bacterium]